MKHADNQSDDARLDELLKKYGEVEPRAGLEGRVLARLTTERAQISRLGWRWRLVLATLTLGAVAGLALIVWKPAPPHQTVTSSAPDANPNHPKTLSTDSRPKPGPISKPSVRRQPRIVAQVVAEPKLEQFPSPAPLTEQEELLVRYIEQSRHEAVLMARAQAELANKEFSPSTEQLPTIQELPGSQ